jgi:hypothetical protein
MESYFHPIYVGSDQDGQRPHFQAKTHPRNREVESLVYEVKSSFRTIHSNGIKHLFNLLFDTF